MSLVVDASVAAKWFSIENLHKEARELLETYGGDIGSRQHCLEKIPAE